MQAGKAAEPRVRQRPVGRSLATLCPGRPSPPSEGLGEFPPLSRQALPSFGEVGGVGRVSGFELRGCKDFSFQDTTL